MKKKVFVFLIVSILLGSLTGMFLYNRFKGEIEVFNEQNKVYFLQLGVYTDKKIMEDNTEKIDPKIVVNKDSKYYVYVGITKDKEIASSIKKIYNDIDIELYSKEEIVTDEQFISNLEQFDSLIKNSTNTDILSIEEVVLASYEELLK